jgi:hypothetical protein
MEPRQVLPRDLDHQRARLGFAAGKRRSERAKRHVFRGTEGLRLRLGQHAYPFR